MHRPQRPPSRQHRSSSAWATQRIARRPSHRPKRFGTLDPRERRRGRRYLSLALAAVWLVGLVALVLAPWFQVKQVVVSGNERLRTDQVVAAAGLQHPGSIFLVDPGGLERRLTATTWVRAASVRTEFPDRVAITVAEWQPAAVYRAAGGPLWYLSAEAVALGPAAGADAASLLDIDGPAQPAVRTGRAPMDRALLTALVNIQRALPGLIGQDVQSFTIDSCGNLTMNSRRGWKAQFGRVNTPSEMASLKDKIAALRSLSVSGDVDLNTIGYVNLMNPYAVAVPAPTPRPGRAAATPSPSPSPAPAAQAVSPCR